MKIAELKELLDLITERNITEFELEEEGVKLRIKKGGVAAENTPRAETRPVVAAAPIPAAPEPAEVLEEGVSIVTAPMVGTFYRQPEPGADPFADRGDQVKKGQILCIIEAMKLMNEIEAEIAGELVKVFVEDGQSVQYGDKLFAIRES